MGKPSGLSKSLGTGYLTQFIVYEESKAMTQNCFVVTKKKKTECCRAHVAASMTSRPRWLLCFPQPERLVEAEKVDLYDTRAIRSPGAIVPYGGLFHVG